MGDYHPAFGDVGNASRKLGGNVFVRQSVKAITLQALVMKLTWNCKALDNGLVGPVEGGIERRRLQKIRAKLTDRSDNTQAVRLMQWRKHCQRVDRFDYRVVDEDRAGKLVAAVNYAMTD
jgi:hypothetical protein